MPFGLVNPRGHGSGADTAEKCATQFGRERAPVTTTDPFDPRYLDEIDLRRELTELLVGLLERPAAGVSPRWIEPVRQAVGATADGRAQSLSPDAQDRIVDSWATHLDQGDLHPPDEDDLSPAVIALVRRALQVRVRNDGITPRLWIDRTFAGRRAPWARALVRAFGTSFGGGSCRCLDEPVVPGWECCGSPWLDNGDLEQFIRRGRSNVALLAAVVSSGRTVASIDDPVCRSVVTDHYRTYIGGPAAELVAAAYLAAGDSIA